MAMTPKEKQDAFKARNAKTLADLTALATKLGDENATLQKKLDAATRKIHSMEIELLKLQK